MSGYDTPITHRHADGTEHAHGGSDNRELNRFLRSVGQIKTDDRRPDGTYGDAPHSHRSLSLTGEGFGPDSGPVVWSERENAQKGGKA